MKTLYHYTCLEHLPKILREGVIRTTESNVSAIREHAGPDVVWLTTDADCRHGHGIGMDTMVFNAKQHGIPLTPDLLERWDKTRIRFTVRLPNTHVHRWSEWSHRFQMAPEWRKSLIRAAGGGVMTWRVVEHPIMVDRWLEVVDRHTGEVLWLPRGRRDVPPTLTTTGGSR